ncbi:unnamed protein product, partial [Candidula unifasciata]
VRVNSVNPGFFPTRVLRHFGDDLEKVNSSIVALEADKAVLRGRVGTVGDFAQAALFLASDAAGFITGELLKVDGGRSHGGQFVLQASEKVTRMKKRIITSIGIKKEMIVKNMDEQ